MSHQKRISRRIQPTIWQALNEPVVEVSEGFAKRMLQAAAIMLVFAWVMPFWGAAGSQLPTVVYHSPIIDAGAVLGAQTGAAPDWYLVAQNLPHDVSVAFIQAANQVLDVSAPVISMVETYGPGVRAVKDAWLELMADPH